MGIIAWLFLGLIAGFIGRAIMPGTQNIPIWQTILVGIGGAVLGGWLSSKILHIPMDGINLKSVLIAGVGSFLVLFIWAQISKASRRG